MTKLRAMTATTAAATLVAALAVPGRADAAPPGPLRAGSGAAVSPTFELRTRVADSSGEHLKVTVGDETYRPPDAAPWICPTGVWVLQLERDSLEERASDSYPMCTGADAKRLTDLVTHLPSEPSERPIVIVNSLDHAPGGDSRTLPDLGKALAKIGAPADEFAAVDLARTAFSVYGISGLAAGQGYTAKDELAAEASVPAGKPTEASINGDLALDNHANFTLTMPDYALYDIAADGAISLDGHAHPVPDRPAGFKGGFHVLVADRRTLEPISDTLYPTNDDPSGQYRMGTDLARLAVSRGQSVLVFLATVGDPVGGRQLLSGPATFPAPCRGSTAFTVTCTYKHAEAANRGKEQRFVVPAEVAGYPVADLHVTLQGGYGGYAKSGGEGGNPDRVIADLPVGSGKTIKPGQTIYVEVAGQGTSGGNVPGGLGGWNGGAPGGSSDHRAGYGWPGGGGGGASDIRTVSRDIGDSDVSLHSRLAVAGGGGGAGGDSYDAGRGGDGGNAGSSGGDGLPGKSSKGQAGGGGGAGTSSHGGAAGTAVFMADPGALGTGGRGSFTSASNGASGGGGGGYYGGGGGGVGGAEYPRYGGSGGGGGGSDLVPAGGTAAPVTRHEPATVMISYPVPYGTLAQALRPFGATPTVVDGLDSSPRYALAGALNSPAEAAAGLSPDSPEASPQISAGATGQLQGVLQRGHQDGWYESITSNAPTVRSFNGRTQPPTVTNYGLYHVISHVDAPWPVPVAGADHDAQQKALTYLSQQACGCDNIRDQYNAAPSTIEFWQKRIDTVPFPFGKGFDAANFRKVRNQLDDELDDVQVVDGLKQGMRTLLSDQQHMLPAALKQAYDEVRESVKVDDNTKTIVSIVSFILELATIAAEVTGQHEVAAFFGVVNAVLKLSTELTNDESGNDEDSLARKADELGEDTAANFAAALTSLSQTFSYLYENWGKLDAVATGLTKHNKEWDVTTQDPGQYVTATADAAKLGYYRALVGVTYQRFEAQAAPTSVLGDLCIAGPRLSGKKCHTAADYGFAYPSSAYAFDVAAPAARFRAAHDISVVTVNTGAGWDSVHALSAKLMNKLKETGLYAPYLFLRWPMIKGVRCPANFWIYPTTGSTSTGTVFDCRDEIPTLASPPGVGSSMPLTITTTGLPAATVGQPYRAALSAAGGDGGTHRWTLAKAGRLPAGITLSGNGVLSGTPTTAGQYRFTVNVDDSVTKTLILTVHAASTAPAGGDRLAFTGVPAQLLLALALALLLAGIALSMISRRRSR